MGEAPTRNNRANRIEDYRSRIPLGELIVFPPAMTQAQLQEIPKAVIKKEHTDLLIQCGICFHEFQLNEDDVRQLPCNHMYHSKCIFPWLPTNPSCPTCRASLPNQNDDDFEDVIREHFDRLTSDLMRYLAERGIEHGRLSVEENGSARTLRSSANLRRFERFETSDDDHAPRRAAALRADRAIQQIYRPRRTTVSAPTRDTRNVRIGTQQDRSPTTM